MSTKCKSGKHHHVKRLETLRTEQNRCFRDFSRKDNQNPHNFTSERRLRPVLSRHNYARQKSPRASHDDCRKDCHESRARKGTRTFKLECSIEANFSLTRRRFSCSSILEEEERNRSTSLRENRRRWDEMPCHSCCDSRCLSVHCARPKWGRPMLSLQEKRFWYSFITCDVLHRQWIRFRFFWTKMT